MLPLLAAFAASLALHAGALFGPEIPWPVLLPEVNPPLQAELRPLPRVASEPAPVMAMPTHPPRSTGEKRKKAWPLPAAEAAVPEAPLVEAMPAGGPADATPQSSEPALPAVVPAAPRLSGSGYIRYQVSKESLGLVIGWVEQVWEFSGDGRYRLRSRSETSGLASLFRPVRFESESAGRLVVDGLQPEFYRTRKNGRDLGENADFDWSTVSVTLARDGRMLPVQVGTQDLLSFPYQLAYLLPAGGAGTLGVVSGRSYEVQQLEVRGEETIETPAGRFSCIHLLVRGGNLTEVWLAFEHSHLPVKIRFTDKKGESYVQLAQQIGSGDPPLPEPNTGNP
ncbi:DUF3108 domain-containing protein [Dechloromonas sp. ZY10]|uniref:DUF3108 domain-containing protein n=1 Tax=Dechloromonas aquae TaxID=2664436 RepID=UPI0035286F3C